MDNEGALTALNAQSALSSALDGGDFVLRADPLTKESIDRAFDLGDIESLHEDVAADVAAEAPAVSPDLQEIGDIPLAPKSSTTASAHESRLEVNSSPLTVPSTSMVDSHMQIFSDAVFGGDAATAAMDEQSLTFAGKAPPLALVQDELKKQSRRAEMTDKRILAVALLFMSMVCGGLVAVLVLRHEKNAVVAKSNTPVVLDETPVVEGSPFPSSAPSSGFSMQSDGGQEVTVIGNVQFNVTDGFYSSTTTPSNELIATEFPSDLPSDGPFATSSPTSFDDDDETDSSDSSSSVPSMAPTTASARLGKRQNVTARAKVTLAPTATPACDRVYPTQPPLPGKKGAAMRLNDEGQDGSWEVNLPRVVALRPYWNYNWGPIRREAQPDDIEFVPMIWGGHSMDVLQAKLNEHVVPLIESGVVKRLFGFNEPDLAAQSNMKVERALDLWSAFEATGLPLTSPSCAHPERDWMQTFMDDVEETCKRVDWLGVHWYGDANFAKFKADITQYYTMYGRERPIIITEFAVADWKATTVDSNKFSAAQVLAFMKQAVPWLESQSWVVGYAWFNFAQSKPQGTSSALFDEQGSLTTLGRYYASVRTNRPRGNQSIGASSSS